MLKKLKGNSSLNGRLMLLGVLIAGTATGGCVTTTGTLPSGTPNSLAPAQENSQPSMHVV